MLPVDAWVAGAGSSTGDAVGACISAVGVAADAVVYAGASVVGVAVATGSFSATDASVVLSKNGIVKTWPA